MKVGDLVKHTPHKSTGPVAELYDVGHPPDFKMGLILHTRESFHLIHPTNGKPAWYQKEELELVNKS